VVAERLGVQLQRAALKVTVPLPSGPDVTLLPLPVELAPKTMLPEELVVPPL